MEKYVVKSLKEMEKEVDEKEEEDISKGNGDQPNFTNAEAKELLTVIVQDSARWKLAQFFPNVDESNNVKEISSISGNTVTEVPTVALDDDEVEDIVADIYRSTVKQWRYDPVMLQICRKAKFDQAMVRTIVDGMVDEMEEESEEESGVAPVGKSLARSLDRVSQYLRVPVKDLFTAKPTIDVIRKCNVAYPERIYAFLQTTRIKKII